MQNSTLDSIDATRRRVSTVKNELEETFRSTDSNHLVVLDRRAVLSLFELLSNVGSTLGMADDEIRTLSAQFTA